MEELHDRMPLWTDLEVRSLLGQVRITGENVYKQIGVISGGERAKVCFAVMMLEHGNVLILDEPTNHIDNETVQLLEDQLRKYRGAIVMVTHDRYFLNRVTQKIVEVDHGSLFSYNGNYQTYLEQKAQREADAQAQERKNRTLYRQELEWIRRGGKSRTPSGNGKDAATVSCFPTWKENHRTGTSF